MEQYTEETIVEKATRNIDGWYMRLLRWREHHIPERTFVVVLAIVLGVASGLAAVLLKFLISTISSLVNNVSEASHANFYYLVFPILGILLTGLYVRYVVRDNISHGVTRVLYAIAQRKSRLKFHNMYASLAASSVTIGCGGSVGAEGPIVFTGAAIGSNLGQAFRLSPQMLMMLSGMRCGSGYCRHLQGANRRRAVHRGSADARPHCRLRDAADDGIGGWCHCGLCVHGL